MKWKLKHLLMLTLLATSQTIVAMEEQGDDADDTELKVGDIVPGINIEKIEYEKLGLPYHNGESWEKIWGPILEQEDKEKRRKKYAFKIDESSYEGLVKGINAILYKNEQCKMLLPYKKLAEVDKSLDMILKAKNIPESQKIILMKKMVAAGANINYDNAFSAVCHQRQWHLARLMLCLGANIIDETLEAKLAQLNLANDDEEEEEADESNDSEILNNFFKSGRSIQNKCSNRL